MFQPFSRQRPPVDKALQSALDWWESVGIEIPVVPASGQKKARPTKPAVQKNTPPVSTRQNVSPPPAKAPVVEIEDPAKVAALAKTLSELEQAIDKYDAGRLSDGARQSVFARGNPDSAVMIIGEIPGREDDIAGRPYVGETGQLLDRMLASIGLNESNSYITTILNWRPAKDRNPKTEELELFKPFIDRHITLFEPKLILIVGGISLGLLTDQTSIMKNRGQWQMIALNGSDVPAMPIYHPSLLLSQPGLKKEAWRDLLAFRARIDELAGKE